MRRHPEEPGQLTDLEFTSGHGLCVLRADANGLSGEPALQNPQPLFDRPAGYLLEVLFNLGALFFVKHLSLAGHQQLR
ncbi:hypothetical protein D3C75_1276520 [compost metagenome]